MRRLFTALAIIGLLTITPASYAAQLMAGAASADLTPEPGLRMWGYGARLKPSTGVLDPITAKTVVLKAGEDSVAIVSLDLGRTPTDPMMAELKKNVADKAGVKSVFITASHTHSAPAVEIKEYGQMVIRKIEESIVEAAGKLEPVTFGVGRGEADYSHNRRVVQPDGTVFMLWRNAERRPTEPIDREFGVVRLNRKDGTPLAIMFHYACHPVVLGPDNLKYSADFVGAARETVEKELNTTCLYLQGACGDINPYMDKSPIDQGGVEEMRKMGTGLGELLVKAARKIETTEEEGSIEFSSRRFNVGLRFNTRLISGNSVFMDQATLVINDRLALVGMPGEIFVDFQLDLKNRSPIKDTFLVGYCNGFFGYFPTIRHAALGGYGGSTATFVAVGTGEKMVNDALITLYQMQGKLKEVVREEGK